MGRAGRERVGRGRGTPRSGRGAVPRCGGQAAATGRRRPRLCERAALRRLCRARGALRRRTTCTGGRGGGGHGGNSVGRALTRWWSLRRGRATCGRGGVGADFRRRRRTGRSASASASGDGRRRRRGETVSVQGAAGVSSSHVSATQRRSGTRCGGCRGRARACRERCPPATLAARCESARAASTVAARARAERRRVRATVTDTVR